MYLLQRLRRGRIQTWNYTVTCEEHHCTEVPPEDLAKIEYNLLEFNCPECGGHGIELEPSEVQAECLNCGGLIDVHVVDFAGHDLEYNGCLGGGPHDWSYVGTEDYYREVVQDLYGAELTDVESRGDSVEIVVHFTKYDSFIQIMRERRLKAKPTGFYCGHVRPREVREQSKAVCLTEIPLRFASEFVAQKTWLNHVGFAFLKRDVLEVGGGPVLNIPRKLLDRQRDKSRGATDLTYGWVPALLPFINQIDEGFNYTDEREWRIPKDVDFGRAAPWLVIPKHALPELYAREVSGREVAKWVKEFGLIQFGDPDGTKLFEQTVLREKQ